MSAHRRRRHRQSFYLYGWPPLFRTRIYMQDTTHTQMANHFPSFFVSYCYEMLIRLIVRSFETTIATRGPVE